MTAGEDVCPYVPASLAASPPLFRHPLLDRLSRVHHLVPLLLFGPAAVVLLGIAATSGVSWTIIAVSLPAGYVMWTLTEYFGHRFLFHWRFTTATGKKLQFLIHGVHHDHPSDPLRLVMPPLMSLPIMAAAWTLLRAALGGITCLPVLSGFIAGYLVYDMLHYHIHHGVPRTRLGRFLRFRHMHHHFRDDCSSYGVSAPWWDAVFGTRVRNPCV
jgi:dihydroceramide fatty acyl 2-hydroxylase